MINVVKYPNLEQAVETKSGISRLRPMEQDKQEEWLYPPELQIGKVLIGSDEITELMCLAGFGFYGR